MICHGARETVRRVNPRLASALKTAGTWALTLGAALALGKGIQSIRDGEAPPVASPAPAIDGVELADGAPTLLYFWAEWCGVCKIQSPIVESVKEVPPACGKVVRVDDATERQAFRDYGVRVLPTMVVVDGEGRVTKRHLGITTKWQLVRALRSAGGRC